MSRDWCALRAVGGAKDVKTSRFKTMREAEFRSHKHQTCADCVCGDIRPDCEKEMGGGGCLHLAYMCETNSNQMTFFEQAKLPK